MSELEKAANLPEVDTTNEQSTPPVEEKVSETQAFAKRLKEEKAKAKTEALEELAQSFGYKTYNEYIKAQTDDKLLNNGFDPEKVRPVVEELIAKDPRYINALKKAEEYENIEKEIFAKTSLDALNAKFGTTYKSINDLDKDTIDMWNAGTSLEKAFAANNYSLIQELAVKKVTNAIPSGKDHLKSVPAGVGSSKVKLPSEEEKAMFRKLIPGVTDEQITAFVNK